MTPKLLVQIIGLVLIVILFLIIAEIVRRAVWNFIYFIVDLVFKPFKWFKNKVLKIKDKEEYINIKIIDKEKEET